VADYLLDTSALLAHHREENGWERVQAIFEQEGARIFLASVSLTEFGRRLRELGAGDDDISRSIEGYEFLCEEIVAIDRAIAMRAFEVGRLTPQRLPLVDSLIAACADARRAILVHRDHHMKSIPPEIVIQEDLGPVQA
jgi:predicted nucleic acid-binding protein